MAPVGSLSPEDAQAAFAEQARALADGGVDVLWIETMSSREEVEAAVAGAAGTPSGPDCPPRPATTSPI
jgi:5-methyltetrahydrofolate--homocysteine methyltransferase